MPEPTGRKQTMALPVKKTPTTVQKTVKYVEVSYSFDMRTLCDRLRECHSDIPASASLRFYWDDLDDDESDPDGVEVYWPEDMEIIE